MNRESGTSRFHRKTITCTNCGLTLEGYEYRVYAWMEGTWDREASYALCLQCNTEAETTGEK